MSYSRGKSVFLIKMYLPIVGKRQARVCLSFPLIYEQWGRNYFLQMHYIHVMAKLGCTLQITPALSLSLDAPYWEIKCQFQFFLMHLPICGRYFYLKYSSEEHGN